MIHKDVSEKTLKMRFLQRPLFEVPGPLGPGTPKPGLSETFRDCAHTEGVFRHNKGFIRIIIDCY